MATHQPPEPSDDHTEYVSLREHFEALLAEADRRYRERFEAQTEAINAALAAANRTMDEVGTTTNIREQVAELRGAVHALDTLTDAKFVTFRTLIDSQAEKVALALSSSDKAVSKAETATEKRFEGVNEFREQLRDQASTLMPRVEAEQRISQNAEKIGELVIRIDALSSRIDRTEGRSGGHTDSNRNIVTIIGLVLAALTIVVSIYLASHK